MTEPSPALACPAATPSPAFWPVTTKKLGQVLAGLALGAALLLPARAEAQTTQPSLALDRYNPAPAGDRFFGLSDAEVPENLQVDAWLVLDYAHNPLVVEYTDASGRLVEDAIVAHQLFGHLGGAVSLWKFLKLDLSIPVALYQKGSDPAVGGGFQSPSGADFGDIRFGARAQLFSVAGGAFALAVGGYLWAPTGAQGEGSFASTGHVRGLPQLMASGQLGSFVYAANFGVDLQKGRAIGGTVQGSRFQANAAVGVLFGKRQNWQVGPEANLGLTLKDVSPETTNSELLLGAKWRFIPAFVAGLGGGMGVSGGAGTPDARVLASIAFSPRKKDADGDGILDQDDACPRQKGQATGDPATHGCPDTDGDGIVDGVDACVTEPGVASSDPAKNGCPMLDSDGDGILDAQDACPADAGEASDDPAKNGCPADADGDGVFDAVDACPSIVGPKNEDPEKNGCPPDRDEDGVLDQNDACPDDKGLATDDPTTNGCPDSDDDGIFDKDDACPTRAGRPSNDPKKHGCPVVEVETDRIVILQKIQFAVGSAVIERQSDSLLDDIAAVLREQEGIEKLEIQGHTDSRGSRWMNTKLSRDRAASVKKALIERGIDADRLTSKGFGPTVPIAENETDEGREKNRRVEFKILRMSQAQQGKGAAR